MASDNVAAVSAFIEGAPPGEVSLLVPHCHLYKTTILTFPSFLQLADVVNGTQIPWPLPLSLIKLRTSSFHKVSLTHTSQTSNP